MMQYSWHSS